MKKILFTLMAVVLCTGMMGAAFAQFSDTETSTGNVFQAGSTDLQISNGGPWVDTPPALTIASAANMAPGVEVGPYDVWFLNAGSLPGFVRVNLSYIEDDADPETGEYAFIEASADDYAKNLIVTQAYLDNNGAGTNVAPYWALQVADDAYGYSWAAALAANAVVADGSSATGYLPTVFGLEQITLEFSNTYNGPEWIWGPSDFHYEVIYLELNSAVNNDYQFDGIDISLTATLSP